jgi:peptide/nickel transport system permease protein
MTTPAVTPSAGIGAAVRDRWGQINNSPRLSVALVAGLVIIFLVFMFGLLGPLFVDMEQAEVASVTPKQEPGAEYWLGTDSQGRSILAVMIAGTPQTLKIGLIAGTVGIVVGLFLGMVAGFFGGIIDATIRVISDALLTVPAIAILIIIAANVDEMSVELMGITVAVLAWMFPTRTIRAQVLTIKERAYMEVARVNGQKGLGLVFREVFPNLLPFIMASFVGAVGSAMLAAVGLEALGLGANQVHTLGTIIYWAQKFSAVLRGQWWWWGPPIVMIAVIFMGLFLLSIGLDRFANPRLRQQT